MRMTTHAQRPQPLPRPSTSKNLSFGYDMFICALCISSIPAIAQYVGTPGVLMSIRSEGGEDNWKALHSREGEDTLVYAGEEG
jgi:hypothetical protein